MFMECGSDGHGDTEWLEKVLSWRGLLTQPHPESFSYLHKIERSKSHLAQVCISPTIHPKHVSYLISDYIYFIYILGSTGSIFLPIFFFNIY